MVAFRYRGPAATMGERSATISSLGNHERKTRTTKMRRPSVRAEAILVLLLAAGALLPSSAQEPANPIQEIDALTVQWTNLEHQKDELRSQWRSQEPVLEQQLALLEREITELNALLEATAAQQDDVEQRRLELLEEQTRLEEESAELEASLMQASLALHSLHRGLPPPLARFCSTPLRSANFTGSFS